MLKQMEAGRAVKDLARELGVSQATLYTWKSKYGGLDVNEARRLRELEDENRRLKHMVAALSLDKEALKAVIRKMCGLPLFPQQVNSGQKRSAQMYSVFMWVTGPWPR